MLPPSSQRQAPRHRLLLPGPGLTEPASIVKTRLVLPKKITTPIACETCRKRKSKAKGLDCVYRDPPAAALDKALKERDSSLAALELFRAVQTRGEAEAAEIYRRIRLGDDPEAVLRQVTCGDLLLQLHVEPETRLRYEFPYVTKMPDYLQAFDNAYLRSQVYEWTSKYNASESASRRALQGQAQYSRPYQAATLVEPKIDQVRPSQWTMVSSDDASMRAVLRAYFQFDYPFFSFFHKDSFLDDMASGGEVHCSRLLVNAVLAAGSHCLQSIAKRPDTWDPLSMAYRFAAEAERLWKLETSEQDLLPKLQASMIMNVQCNISGIDKTGFVYLLQGAAMAHRLRLFELQDGAMLRPAFAYTAWCFFWLQSTLAYIYKLPPLLQSPPKSPLPDPIEAPAWYGELFVRYPQSESLVPLQHGQLQRARLEQSCFINNVASAVAGGQPNAHDLVSRAMVGLEAWYKALPPCLSPQNIVFPSQLKIHLHYYNILMELHKLLQNTAAQHSSRQPGSPTIAEACFESILRLYYLRHSFEISDAMLTQFLTVFAMNASQALAGSREPIQDEKTMSADDSTLAEKTTVRSALVLAIKGLRDQGQYYFFPQKTSYLLLSQLAPDDANLVQKFAHVSDEARESRVIQAREIPGHFPPDIMHVLGGGEDVYSSELIRQYARVVLDFKSDAAGAAPSRKDGDASGGDGSSGLAVQVEEGQVPNTALPYSELVEMARNVRI
ncbi:hypothetical protein ED733_008622 [Metarhizium rileyi]|uniref:Xylanolytic transcriptional activator regulatory domain-containing protein n=1 Tax=Metarhizium rileyi (strain RCEF 4871) TaxID=1649241 RepID=A0A5C6GMS3_METRR|nr:hypothetical protein ED733_008622 [Metarhizium rileyi]